MAKMQSNNVNKLFVYLILALIIVFGSITISMVLYLPLWYKIHVGRLISNNCNNKLKVAKNIANKGKPSIPYVTELLNSNNNNNIIGACLIIKYMSPSLARQFYSLLEDIMRKHPSERTDAAISAIINHGVCFEKRYGTEEIIMRNYYIYQISYDADVTIRRIAAANLVDIANDNCVYFLVNALMIDADEDVRAIAGEALGETGAHNVGKYLVSSLQEDPSWFVRKSASDALGKIKYGPAAKSLFCAMCYDNDTAVAVAAADALAEIKNKAIVDLLHNVLNRNQDPQKRGLAAVVLGSTSDERSIPYLIKSLHNEQDEITRLKIVEALSAFGHNENVLKEMFVVLNNDSSSLVRNMAGLALSHSKSSDVIKELRNAAHNGNEGAHIALAWQEDKFGFRDILFLNVNDDPILQITRAYFGNIISFEKTLGRLPNVPYFFIPFLKKLLSRLPDNIPTYCFDDKYQMRKKQAEKIYTWYKKNKHRFAWNPNTRKYYLKPEKNPGKAEESTGKNEKQEKEK